MVLPVLVFAGMILNLWALGVCLTPIWYCKSKLFSFSSFLRHKSSEPWTFNPVWERQVCQLSSAALWWNPSQSTLQTISFSGHNSGLQIWNKALLSRQHSLILKPCVCADSHRHGEKEHKYQNFAERQGVISSSKSSLQSCLWAASWKGSYRRTPLLNTRSARSIKHPLTQHVRSFPATLLHRFQTCWQILSQVNTGRR